VAVFVAIGALGVFAMLLFSLRGSLVIGLLLLSLAVLLGIIPSWWSSVEFRARIEAQRLADLPDQRRAHRRRDVLRVALQSRLPLRLAYAFCYYDLIFVVTQSITLGLWIPLFFGGGLERTVLPIASFVGVPLPRIATLLLFLMLPWIVLLVVAVVRFRQVRSLARSLTTGSRCFRCHYHILEEIDAERCPECGYEWPVVPPPIGDESVESTSQCDGRR
jgi:hypothetical protein